MRIAVYGAGGIYHDLTRIAEASLNVHGYTAAPLAEVTP